MPYHKGPGVKKSGPKGPRKVKGPVLDALVELLREKKVNPVEVRGSSSTRLGLLTSLVYELDFASYYAALLRRVDPYPIATINRLKSG